jgi:ribosome-binding protein aMBF1 (putative translation factor)
VSVRVRELREAAGFSRGDLTAKVAIGRRALDRFEAEHGRVAEETLRVLADALGVDPADLREGSAP